MPKPNPHIFLILYRNELEKLWAWRMRALIIALVVIVVGGTFIAYQNYHASQAQAETNIAQLKSQIAQERSQLAHMHSGKSTQILEQQLQGTQSALRQMEQNPPNTGIENVRQQLATLKSSLKNTPSSQQGNTLQQIAIARYQLAHGITTFHPNDHGGYRIVGQIFGGTTMLLFGLVALGLTGDRVSSEIESGTLGSLLLHAPWRRSIYLAKLGTALTVTWAFMAASAVGFFLMASALMGTGHPMNPHAVGVHLKMVDGEISVPVQTFHLLPQWSYDLTAFGLALLAIGAFVAIFLALSMVTRSTVLSLIVGAVLIISNILGHTLGPLAVANPAMFLPLMQVWTGQEAFDYQMLVSLGTAFMVLLAWTAAALLVGLWSARRLDV
ncbi:MAG: ABC transporter permease subunit [Firmicutes bacterium]|nr:ABC transporter permease subunit [Bacillota bacterium]